MAGKQALWSRRETWLLADRLSVSYRSGWAVALRALLNLLTEQTPGWIWSPLGTTGKTGLFFFFNVLFSISCPRTFSKWLSRIWGQRSPVPGRVTFPQIGALKLQVASRWLPVAH